MATASTRAIAMEFEHVWRYISELRRAQRISQERMAAAVGLSRQGWRDIENGVVDDPRASVLLRAIRHVKGSFEDVRELVGDHATTQTALSLAQARSEAIAAHQLGALRETVSNQEFADRLQQVENEIARLYGATPSLRSFWRSSDDQPDE